MSRVAPMHEEQFLFFWCYQQRRCYLCSGRMRHPCEGHCGHSATTDHVMPVFHGGRRRSNLLLAHRGCNCRKSDRPPTACERLFAEIAWDAYQSGVAPRKMSGKTWGDVDQVNLSRLGGLFSKAEKFRQKIMNPKKAKIHGQPKISVLDRSSGEHKVALRAT